MLVFSGRSRRRGGWVCKGDNLNLVVPYGPLSSSQLAGIETPQAACQARQARHDKTNAIIAVRGLYGEDVCFYQGVPWPQNIRPSLGCVSHELNNGCFRIVLLLPAGGRGTFLISRGGSMKNTRRQPPPTSPKSAAGAARTKESRPQAGGEAGVDEAFTGLMRRPRSRGSRGRRQLHVERSQWSFPSSRDAMHTALLCLASMPTDGSKRRQASASRRQI